MPSPAPLTDRQTQRLITALRHGTPLDTAVTALRIDMAAVWPTARHSERLAVALTGRDPDTTEEAARAARAAYLHLLALGVPAARAELAIGTDQPGKWRSEDPAFARACAAVTEAAAPYRTTTRPRLTPQTVATFLEALENGASVKAAAAAAGITHTAVYQRRRRDTEFATAMDEARAAHRAG